MAALAARTGLGTAARPSPLCSTPGPPGAGLWSSVLPFHSSRREGPCRAAPLLSREPGGGLAFHPQPPGQSVCPPTSTGARCGPLPGCGEAFASSISPPAKPWPGRTGVGAAGAWALGRTPGGASARCAEMGGPCASKPGLTDASPPRPVPTCTAALSTPAGNMVWGEGPARDPVLGPLTDPLLPQSGVSTLQKGEGSFCRWFAPPPHPLRPLLKAWGAAWLPGGGRDLRATVPALKPVTRGHCCPCPCSPDLSRPPFSFAFLCLVLSRGLGPPDTNGRVACAFACASERL